MQPEKPKRSYNCYWLLQKHYDRVQEGFTAMGVSPREIDEVTCKYIVDEFKRGSRSALRNSRILTTICVAVAAPCALSLAHGLITSAPTTTLNVISSLFLTGLGASAFFSHKNYMRRVQELNAQTATLTEPSHPGDERAYEKADARIRKRFAEPKQPKYDRDDTLRNQQYAPPKIIIDRSLGQRPDMGKVTQAISESLKL